MDTTLLTNPQMWLNNVGLAVLYAAAGVALVLGGIARYKLSQYN